MTMRLEVKPATGPRGWSLGIPLLGILVLAAALRLWGTEDKGMWNDEAFSWAISKGSLAELIAALRADFHPPLYYIALWFWQSGFGDSPTALRSLSVLAGCLSVVAVAALATRVFSPRVGVIAASLLAMHPTHLLWSQNVRGYAVLYGACALALLCAFEALRSDARRTHGWWAGYVVATLCAMYTHNTGIIFWMVLTVALAVLAMYRGRATWQPFAMASATILLGYLPWISALVHQASAIQQMRPNPLVASPYVDSNWSTIGSSLVEGLSASHVWALRPVSLAVFGALLLLGLFRALRSPNGRVLAWLLVATLTACALGYAWLKPVFAYMALTSRWLHLVVVVLVAAGVAELLERPALAYRIAGVSLGACALALSALGVRGVFAAPVVDWRGLVAQAVTAHPEKHLVATSTLSLWAPQYYTRSQTPVVLGSTEARQAFTTDPRKGHVLFFTHEQDPWLADFSTRHPLGKRLSSSCIRGACMAAFEPADPLQTVVSRP